MPQSWQRADCGGIAGGLSTAQYCIPLHVPVRHPFELKSFTETAHNHSHLCLLASFMSFYQLTEGSSKVQNLCQRHAGVWPGAAMGMGHMRSEQDLPFDPLYLLPKSSRIKKQRKKKKSFL